MCARSLARCVSHVEEGIWHTKTLGTNEAQQELELTRNVQAIWHLTDLVFLSTASGDPFPDAFVTWLNVSYPCTPAAIHPPPWRTRR